VGSRPLERYPEPRPSGLGNKLWQFTQAVGWRSGGCVVAFAQYAEQPAHLRQGGAASVLDRPEGTPRLSYVGVNDVVAHPGLYGDD
jgi:hypothetical protein